MDNRKNDVRTWIRLLIEFILIVAIMACICAFFHSVGLADEYDGNVLYVTANRLNGRSAPRKSAFVETIFDYGDKLVATGKWSRDHKWIEVNGGETGTVWVDIRYVTEYKESFYVESLHPEKFKIRSKPFDGKVKGYLRKGQKLRIDQVVLGWGRSTKGWIDLEYLIVLGDE